MKIRDFSVTQVLREIIIGKSRVSKSAISTHLETEFYFFINFLHIVEAEIHQIQKIQSPKIAKK